MDERRVVVFGHRIVSEAVHGFEWDEVPSGLNVADYRAAILDYSPLGDTPALRGAIELDSLPSQQDFANLVFSEGGEVVAIGFPGLRLGDNPYMPATWWLPAVPRFERKQGTAISNVSDEWRFYFEHVPRWDFHVFTKDVRTQEPAGDYLLYLHPRAASLSAYALPLAETRYGLAVAFNLKLKIRARPTSRDASGHQLAEGNGVYWLPTAFGIDRERAVGLILHERYGISLTTAPPAWAERFLLAHEKTAKERLEKLEGELSTLKAELDAAQIQLDRERRPKGLLYEKGEPGLEKIVRATLRELGADVDAPDQRGREDGRLTDPKGRQAILEIKGRSGSLKLSDVRQLEQWRVDAEDIEGWAGKPILIADLMCELPPSERGEVFPSNCVQTATRYGHCLLRTTQLYQAISEKQAGEFDENAFWNSVFEAEGPCDLPDVGE